MRSVVATGVTVAVLIGLPLAPRARARTLLVTPSEPGEDARRVWRALAGAAGATTLATISERELKRALATSRRAYQLQEARRLAREGWLLLGHLKLVRAARLLQESLARYAAAPRAPESCVEAVGVLRDLAYARWLQHDRAQAGALIAGTAALPPRPVDVTRHPPDFVAFMNEPHAAPPLSTPVVAGDGRAEVWLGCQRRGLAPQQLPITGCGLVAVTAPGRRWSRLVLATEGAVLQAAPRPFSSAEQRAVLSAALRARDASALAQWRRQGGMLQARTFRPREGWGAWRTLTLAAERAGPAPPRRGWRSGQWVLLGASAAALVAGTVCGALARSAADDLEQAAEQGRRFDAGLADVEDRRDGLAVAAYSGWGVGATLGAALVTWLLLDRGAPSR